MKFRFNLYTALCLTTLGTSVMVGCDKVEMPPAANLAEASADDRLAAINDSLARMNYGDAGRQAAEAQALYPGDARLHAAAARAQARLGDAEASAAALTRAVAAGLSNVTELLAEPAFDAVRSHKAFTTYRPHLTAPAKQDHLPTSRIRAGDVEIIESADGDVIRAGDIVLDTRH